MTERLRENADLGGFYIKYRAVLPIPPVRPRERTENPTPAPSVKGTIFRTVVDELNG